MAAVVVFFGVMAMSRLLAPMLEAAWRPVVWMCWVLPQLAVSGFWLAMGVVYGFLSSVSGGAVVAGTAAGMHSDNRGVAQRAQRPGRTSNFSNKVPKQQPGNGS